VTQTEFLEWMRKTLPVVNVDDSGALHIEWIAENHRLFVSLEPFYKESFWGLVSRPVPVMETGEVWTVETANFDAEDEEERP
jgi:hypothetical protein